MRLERIRQRTSLRTRLIVVVLTLSALTVVATSVVAAGLLRAQLVGQVDDELRQSVRPVVEGISRGQLPPQGPGDNDDPFRPSSFSVTVLDADGTVLAQQNPTSSDLAAPALGDLDTAAVQALDQKPVTVEAGGGGGSWRVLAIDVGSGSVAIALPLTGVEQTMRQLVLIDAAVALAALAVLALLAWWAVTSSLRPLDEVGRTAEAIAAGDLSRRVPDHPPTTEVGRLSASLNSMLAQIETAVREQERAADDAQSSEARMRQFVADASHELRTPLTSIRGFSELYRQGAVPAGEDLDRTMARIEDEARRMGLLVEDLLLLARLDQQRPLQRRPVDLVPLVAEVASDMAVLAPDHPISLELPPEGRPAVVAGDDARLRQVLGNLVRNAITHTPVDTPVRIGVSMQTDVVSLSVSDEGPGMSSEDAERAFERFYRADTSRARHSGSGSGLGLSIVAALVAAHDGTVDLATAPGEGTSVTVHLPRLPTAPR